MRLIGIHRPCLRLITLPLGVRQEFFKDAASFFRDEYAVKLKFIRRAGEIEDDRTIYLTNYESVREGILDVAAIRPGAVSLDEAAILRGFGGTKTFREVMAVLAGDDRRHEGQRINTEGAALRFVATATPSPNEYIELLAYAAFLGVMDVGGGKTRFFKRDSTKADNLTLHEHKAKEFWLWIASWAMFLQQPSDTCSCQKEKTYSDKPSDDSSSSRGRKESSATARGSAGASAATRSSPDQAISCAESSPAADACGLSTAEKERDYSPSGNQCSSAAETQSTRIGQITAGEASGSAIVGSHSPTSETTWANHHQAGPSTDTPTTTATTSPVTVDGLRESNRQEIDGSGGRKRGLGADAPADCRCDDGYTLPPLTVQWHEIPSDHSQAGMEKDGQSRMFRSAALGVTEASREKRETIDERVAKLASLVSASPADSQWVIWCDLNAEQDAIENSLSAAGITFSSLRGTQDVDDREQLLEQWKARKTRAIVTKPSMYGAGTNLQQAQRMVFVGIGFKFHEVIQAFHRIYRFGQQLDCFIHFIYTEAEREVRRELERKWAQHEEQVERMAAIIREYGLSSAAMSAVLARSIGTERREAKGERFTLVNNDCVDECRSMPADSVDLIVTSIPFSHQYEYSPSYNDFGHTDDNAHFWRQMDFLTPELLRVLHPGRVCAIHVKDRVTPGGINGFGFQTVTRISDQCADHFERHGFAFLGRKTIVTDVVRENNQTYRLGWSEQCKDGSRMGAGLPEYVLLFRKPPTDRSNGYADTPVEKVKKEIVREEGKFSRWENEDGYSRARWQYDAHGFTRSSGNRLLQPEDLDGLPQDQIFKLFRRHSLTTVYDFEREVGLAEHVDESGWLPSTFMLMPPQSWHPDVWTDITRMRTLNADQYSRGQEMHLCLARDSRVLTKERGYVPIQDVVVGEHALTHKGRWRPVLAVQNTGVRSVVTVRAQGVPGLTLTPDHKLWMRKTDWVRERDGAERVEPGWIEAKDALGGYLNLKLPECEQRPAIELADWWIVGRWIADGHFESRGAAMISCGKHERGALLAALGDRAGGAYDTGTACQVRLLDPTGDLKSVLRRCGHGADGKFLPPEAFTLPESEAHALLSGYLSGDGHFHHGRERYMASSVSRTLLLGIAILVQRVHGAIASVYAGRPARGYEIDGRIVQCKQDWILSFDLDSDRRKKPFILEDGAWKRVRSIEDSGEIETWNIRVDEDESYTAEGCIVKNCPLQFDIVDRLITQFSMEGEEVFDPFAGLGTVPVRAVQLKRRGRGCELNTGYWQDSIWYARAAEQEAMMPSLFDLDHVEEAA